MMESHGQPPAAICSQVSMMILKALPWLNATALNRQWWVDFKRGYYGLDKIYDKPFVCPIRFKGMPRRLFTRVRMPSPE